MLARTMTAAIGLLALGTAAWAADPASPADPVVAVVNGDQILRSELEAAAQGLPEQMRQVPLEAIYPMLLDRMIDSELLAKEAERLALADDPAVKSMLDQARSNVMRDALLRQKVNAGTDEAGLKARYEELKKQPDFVHDEVHARHILVDNEKAAKDVITALQGGADFAEQAKAHSTDPAAAKGGDLGFFAKDQMVPEFGEAAFAMAKGDISKAPVKTQFGWHVIQVVDKRKVEPSFEDTAPQLRQDVAREIVTALVTDLRSGAKVERFNIDGTPMPPPAPAGEAPAGEAPAGEAPAQPAKP